MTKKERYLTAAVDMFSRYGVRRTTMGDIAEKAGVSRQTLYAAYASKEEMFAAAMQKKTDYTVEMVARDWEACHSVSEKLDRYFDHAIIAHFEQIKNMPDATDLLAEANGTGNNCLNVAENSKKDMLAALFTPHIQHLGRSGITPDDLADFIQNTSVNFLFTATDHTHLKKLLLSLKLSALALAGEMQQT